MTLGTNRLTLVGTGLVLGVWLAACAGEDNGDAAEPSSTGGQGGQSGQGGSSGRAGHAGWPGSGGSPATNTVSVPSGDFTMGCAGDCEAETVPQHTVTLSAFAIDEYEVTQEQFEACITAGLCQPPSCDWDPIGMADHPVVCVSWIQAKAFCSFKGARLPTEAEWEKAARGDDGRRFPWGDDTPDCTLANFEPCLGSTNPVGTHPSGSSPFGAEDMAGNVWEWVHDRFEAQYYEHSPHSDPEGPDSGSTRVFRGGAYNSPSWDLFAYEREDREPTFQAETLGFRCARDAP